MSAEPAQFDCCECCRPILAFGYPKPSPPICAACTQIPGWFTVPELRKILDPTHDGRDPADQAPVPR